MVLVSPCTTRTDPPSQGAVTHGPWARHAQCKTRGEGVYRRNSLRSNPTPLAPAPPRAYRLRKRRVGGVGVADVGGRGGGLQVVELSGVRGHPRVGEVCPQLPPRTNQPGPMLAGNEWVLGARPIGMLWAPPVTRCRGRAATARSAGPAGTEDSRSVAPPARASTTHHGQVSEHGRRTAPLSSRCPALQPAPFGISRIFDRRLNRATRSVDTGQRPGGGLAVRRHTHGGRGGELAALADVACPARPCAGPVGHGRLAAPVGVQALAGVATGPGGAGRRSSVAARGRGAMLGPGLRAPACSSSALRCQGAGQRAALHAHAGARTHARTHARIPDRWRARLAGARAGRAPLCRAGSPPRAGAADCCAGRRT